MQNKGMFIHILISNFLGVGGKQLSLGNGINELVKILSQIFSGNLQSQSTTIITSKKKIFEALSFICWSCEKISDKMDLPLLLHKLITNIAITLPSTYKTKNYQKLRFSYLKYIEIIRVGFKQITNKIQIEKSHFLLVFKKIFFTDRLKHLKGSI